MHIVYIDDSGDLTTGIFSALIIPVAQWQGVHNAIKAYRQTLKASDGIYVKVEFHATKFVAGRGKIAPSLITKTRRCQIFDDTLRFVAALPGVSLINAVYPMSLQYRAFERLLNRVNTMMSKVDSYAIIICDEGKEQQYTRLRRRMGVFNPIPSRYGQWAPSIITKNITIDRIIEDPVFKQSDRSYLIQLADFCTYALLRRERPLASKSQFGLDKSFDLLRPILNRAANSKDPDGIIRP